MKKCPNCGRIADEKFCGECGTEMVEIPKEIKEKKEESLKTAEKSNKLDSIKKNKKNIIIAALGILVLVLVLILLLGKNGTKKDSYENDEIATDTVDIVEDVSDKINKNDTLTIEDSGWSYSGGFYDYAIKIKNNSPDKTYELPSFKITTYDKEGNVLSVDDNTLSEIKPGETIGYAGLGGDVSKKPDKVDFEIVESKDNWISSDGGSYAGLKQMTTTDVNVSNSDFGGKKYTGKIVNNCDVALDQVAVSVLYKDADGKLIGGDTNYVDGIKANSETPFEIEIGEYKNAKDYEIMVQPW